MKLIVDISDEYYKSIKNTAVFISGQRSGKSFINHLCNAVANGIPQETVTEFADRCRECGAKYGKLLKQEPKTGHCKDCKYFEYDSVAKVDGIPLIVAHEICSKWGDGCKTKEDGYCFLFEPQER